MPPQASALRQDITSHLDLTISKGSTIYFWSGAVKTATANATHFLSMGWSLRIDPVMRTSPSMRQTLMGVCVAGWTGADLLSGVYHWGVDNYGDGSTPVFGSQIAGFQVTPTSAHSLVVASLLHVAHDILWRAAAVMRGGVFAKWLPCWELQSGTRYT